MRADDSRPVAPDHWHLVDDVGEFLRRAGEFLRGRPGVHVMQSTWAERVRVRGVGAFGPGTPSFGFLEQGGQVRGTFYLLPPGSLGLSPLTPPQADALAARLAALGHAPRSVSADQDTATAFADAWRRQTGTRPEPRDVRVRLYRLGTLTPPEPMPAGRGRVLGEQDLEEVMHWCGEFARAVGEAAPTDAASWPRTRFADKRYTLWETPDGTPVSVAGMNPLIGGQIQVDIVYTPPHLRGHGYAAAAVTEVTRAALAAGAQDVVLFADRSNPTSNALYQRLGYRAATDWGAYDFT